MSKYQHYIRSALDAIELEAQAISALAQRIGDSFGEACERLMHCQGRIVVIGMGKSGHIGGKIAATLASTGSPAFFVHPGEANHGDLGMITPKDVVLAISNSGETTEIISLLPLIRRLQVTLISMTGNAESTLANSANINLDISVAQEACPLGLAPTASTTATLVMGDALAVALLQARGFTAEDFALSHPGGSLGKRLLLQVADIMHDGNSVPRVKPNASLGQALVEMTQKGMGMTAIIDDSNTLLGIFTDGDLRRSLDNALNIHQVTMQDIMTTDCKTICADRLAAEALNLMETHKITGLVVINKENQPVGILHLHDILRAGV